MVVSSMKSLMPFRHHGDGAAGALHLLPVQVELLGQALNEASLVLSEDLLVIRPECVDTALYYLLDLGLFLLVKDQVDVLVEEVAKVCC